MGKLIVLIFCISVHTLYAQETRSNHGNKFEQIDAMLPTPNEYRTASGAPGPKYWQQRADYDIACELDETKLQLRGKETITYYNNSPDVLTYIWIQLDENEHDPTSNSNTFDPSAVKPEMTTTEITALHRPDLLQGYGDKITRLTDALDKPLKYSINQTMMRVELPAPLKPGQPFKFKIEWNYLIPNRLTIGGRGGYEYFPEDGNYIFTITQWYPRLCVYSDFHGWQNHQFTGRGEFALTFGNFRVQMTVPADLTLASTGECLNYAQNLTPAQLTRWQKAQTATAPMEIVTFAEAKANEQKRNATTKTWIYKADMVRDFAWTASRKFIWDAMPITVEGKKVMCMSLYGKEAYPLYRRFSTKAVAHTIKTYSHFTIPYPYPVAQSIEASNGMEYPMICFNYGRAEKDGTYTEASKNGMLGVIIHEVGHNFFPMIINSDERQWTWMDEGLNSFTQYLTEELWDNKFPSQRGPAYKIADYMKMPRDQLEPIMSASDNIVQFGNNAYGKPAAGLNILRETIMGRELFDYAFKEYARRWAFKHPEPADLFRTMEDASAIDLDWFWRGWFYGIEPCDISLDSVKVFRANPATKAKTIKDTFKLAQPVLNEFEDLNKLRNRQDKTVQFMVDTDTALQDFYYKYDRGVVGADTSYKFNSHVQEPLSDAEFNTAYANKWYYQLSFNNLGGLVMPIIVEFTFKDSSKQVIRIAAEIWRKNENQITKVFVLDKQVASIRLDPMRETADINLSNNNWPVREVPTRFELFKAASENARNPGGRAPNVMQRSVPAPVKDGQ